LLEGEFPDGRLPDESRLMTEYGEGRNVVRHALAMLQSEGLIARTQGVGTTSRTQKTRLILQDAHGLGHSITAPLRIVSRVIAAEVSRTSRVTAERLDVNVGEPSLVVDVLTYIDGEPAVLLTSHLADPTAWPLVAEAIEVGSWSGDWYELLGSIGLRPVYREAITEAVRTSGIVAELLDAQPGDPSIRVERRLCLGERRVLEFGYSYARGDRIVFVSADGLIPAEVLR